MKTTNVFPLPAAIAMTLFILLALTPGPALAHRIQVVSYPSNNAIVVEATIGRDEPVPPGSEVSVRQGLEGNILLQGQTDAQGQFRFPVPALKAGTSLVINVNAGEGHMGTSYLNAADMSSAQEGKSNSAGASEEETNQISQTKPVVLTLEEQRLNRLVSQAVAREIEPLKHMLAQKLDDRPTLRDIIGGLGWLVGIGGLLMALKKKS